ncbi:MAG: glycosyltransferase [Acidimicrobiales bacterium]
MRARITTALSAARRVELTRDGGIALLVAMMAVNVANFVFNVIMSRMLGEDLYGALGSLLGMVSVVTVVVGALQLAVTQAVAEREAAAGSRVAIGRALAAAGGLGLLALVVMIGLSPALSGFLHLASLLPVVLLAVYLAPSIAGLVPQGVLIGERRFAEVARALLVGVAVRIAVGVILVAIGMGLDGALLASVASAIVTLGMLLWPLHERMSLGEGSANLGVRLAPAALSLAGLGGFAFFTMIDSLLARHYLPASEAGSYVAASTAARIALFLPGAVGIIAFPRLAAARAAGTDPTRVLRQSLSLIAVLAGLAGLAMLVVPGLVVSVLFGQAYSAAAPVLRILGLAAVAMAIVGQLVYVYVARHSGLATALWVGAGGAVALIGMFHGGPMSLAWSMLAMSGLLAVVMLLPVLRPAEHSRDLADIGPSTGELWAIPTPELDVSFVVPYYNPGPRFCPNLAALAGVLERSGVSYEIIAVSDGSTDGCDAMLGAVSPRLRLVRLDHNWGKGQALRVGLSMGRGAYLGFIDADGDLPAEQVASFVALVRSHDPDVVLGSKRHPMSEVAYPPLRRLYSWGFQQLVRVLFALKVRDTQTGLKIVRREVLADVLPRMLEKRFAFDLELLVVARRLGYRRFFEAPVRIEERLTSTVSSRAVWSTLVDTLAIFYRLRVLRWYDRVPGVDARSSAQLGAPEAGIAIAQVGPS